MRPLSVAPATGLSPGGGESALDNEGAQGAKQLWQLQTGARVLSRVARAWKYKEFSART